MQAGVAVPASGLLTGGEVASSCSRLQRLIEASDLPSTHFMYNMPRYIYPPLRNDSGWIRLFRLLPSEDENAIIRGELVEYDIYSSRRATHGYEALSYVWGTSGEQKSIYIGNDRMDVTPNLHTALLHLRDASFPRILWIDAVCINQEDDREKELQIQSMAPIYGVAKKVIVWLGEAADDSGDAFEILRAVAQNINIKIQIRAAHLLAVTSLLDRTWFRRVWVRAIDATLNSR